MIKNQNFQIDFGDEKRSLIENEIQNKIIELISMKIMTLLARKP